MCYRDGLTNLGSRYNRSSVKMSSEADQFGYRCAVERDVEFEVSLDG